MKNNNKILLTPFSEDTRKELLENRRLAKAQLKQDKAKADLSRQLVEHYSAILGESQGGQKNGEKSDDLTPTAFVNKLLHESPVRWISIQEFLFRGRSAFDSGEIVNRGGEIESSIHGVLTRFRNKHLVQTKGHRLSRKYKLKP